MSILTSFMSGGIANSVTQIVMDIVKRFVSDKDQLAKIEAQIAQSQAAINAVEAGSESMFIAGWRPFIGWVCGISFAYHYILLPIIVLILRIFHVDLLLPDFDQATMYNILTGMLGLGGLRSYEKIQVHKINTAAQAQPKFGPGSANYQGD